MYRHRGSSLSTWHDQVVQVFAMSRSTARLERAHKRVEVFECDEAVGVEVTAHVAALERGDERVEVFEGQEAVIVKVGGAASDEGDIDARRA
jgi:hypothetical protein